MKIRTLLTRLLLALVLLLVALWVGLLSWSHSGHLEGFLLEELRARLPEGHSLSGEIVVVPSGTVVLRDLTIGQAHPDGERSILTVERGRIDIDWLGLVSGGLPISSIELLQPTVELHVSEDGETNFDRLLEALEPEEPSDELPELPAITLRHGLVQVSYGEAGAPAVSELSLEEVTLLCRPSGRHSARLSAWLTVLGGDLRAHGELELVRGKEGQAVPRTPQPLQLRARGLELGEAGDAGGRWPALLARHALRGRLDAQAELDLGNGGDESGFGPLRAAEIRLRDVEALPAMFPYPVAELDVVGRLDRQRGLLLDHLDGKIGTAHLRGRGEWSRLADPGSLSLLLTLEGLFLDALLQRAVTESLGPDVWQLANAGGGPIDVMLQIPLDSRPVEDLADLSAQAKVALRGGRLAYRGVYQEKLGREAGFPYPVEDLQGRVTISKNGSGFEDVRISIEEVRGVAGTGIARAEGSLLLTKGTDLLNLSVDATGVSLDETLRTTVEEAFGLNDLWDLLSPSGRAGGGYVSDEDPGRHSRELAFVELADASAQYEAVPYPLHNLTGRIDILGSYVFWREVRGRNGSNRVLIDGDLISDDEGDELRLWVRGENISFDWALRDALVHDRPRIAEHWDAFNPRDLEALVADIDLRGFQPAGSDEFFFDCEAQLEGGELLYEGFPMTLGVESGVFEVSLQPSGLRIELEDLVTRPDRGTVTAEGTLVQPEGVEDPIVDLSIEADEVLLDYELLNAVRGLNEGESTVLDLIHNPRGAIDATVVLRGPAVPELLTPKATIWVKHGSFGLAPQQPRIESFDGHFEIDADRLTGWDLQADVAGGIVRCPELELTFGEPSVLTGRARGRGLPFDSGLMEILPPELRSTLDFIEADSGDLDFELRSFRAEVGDPQSPGATFDATIDLRRLNGRVGFGIENWSGRLRLNCERNAQGRLVTRGELHDARIDFLGERLSDLRARFQFDERQLRVETLEGTFYSGRLEAIPNTLSFDFDGGYRGTIVAAGASLRQLVGDRIAAERDIYGTLQGQLDFESPDGTLDELRGEGTIEIFEGKIWDFPVLSETFRVLSRVVPVVPPAFRTGQLVFSIRNRQLVVEVLAFQSPVLDVSGKGAMRFDGVLDVRLKPSVQSITGIPVLAQLFDLIGGILGGSVGSFRIHGMISAPVTTYTSLVDSVTAIMRAELEPRKVPFASPARERRLDPRF